MRITAFEVPAGADEAFEGARGGNARTLYRALREDADFRFVEVGGPESAAAFPAHPALYETTHADGPPNGADGTTLINPVRVPAGEDDAFLAAWRGVRDLLAAQGGYLGTRLYRSVEPAEFRFVHVTRWSSPLMFARATQLPEFQRRTGAMPFARHPALYTVVDAP